MNEHIDTNALKIADYLDNRMNPEEETAFMEELGENEALRKLYEETLLLQEVLATQEAPSVNTPVIPITSANTAVVSLTRIRWIAVACFAIILTSIGIARWGTYSPDKPLSPEAPPPAIANKNPEQDKIPVSALTDSLFTHYYTAYKSDDDPVEISVYYQHYRDHEYASVLSAKKEDYQLMGTSSKETTLDAYMQLYKGLSFLADKQPALALQQFNPLLKEHKTGKPVYYAAQWYSTLAWLQRKDLSKDSILTAATHAADTVAQGSSPYRQKAILLLKSLQAIHP